MFRKRGKQETQQQENRQRRYQQQQEQQRYQQQQEQTRYQEEENQGRRRFVDLEKQSVSFGSQLRLVTVVGGQSDRGYCDSRLQ